MSENEHVVSGLIRKRAEIAGQIEHAQSTLRQLVIDLDNLDATIRLFSPEIDLDEIRPKALPARNQAFRGEIMRIALNTLRKATKPLGTQEIALQVMAGRGLNTADKGLLLIISKRVGSSLRNMKKRGMVQASDGPGRNVLWEIAR
jgi:hypothetical protein